MRNARVPLVLSLVGATLLTGAPPAAAASPRTARAEATVRSEPLSATGRRVTVDVEVDRLVVNNGRVVARGAATSTVRTRDGRVRRRSHAVALAAAAGSSCRVLYLRLEDLQVKLLGLELNTSTVTVRIAGERQRVLGRLFCRLANAIRLRSAGSAARASRSVNRRLAERPLRIVRVRADLNAQSAQTASPGSTTQTCRVLDLTIGPLDLDLLGLVAEVYGAARSHPVRVVATADPSGGVLGRTLCRLANGEAVATTTPQSAGRTATIDVKVDRFSVQGRRIVARGAATTNVRTRDGMNRTQIQPVELSVGAGYGCRVLYLRLDDLRVELLGLELNTSTVTVRVHGKSSQVLGRLFCRLARAISLQRTAGAAKLTRSLNRGLDGRPLQVLGLRAALYAQDAQAPAGTAPTCPILDLTIGPLTLDLLGLEVDLYGANRRQPVRAVATADPNGGVLGATLCRLANGQANP